MAWLRNHFGFRNFGDSVLVSNDAGQFLFLAESDFQALVQDPAGLRPAVAQELAARLFISAAHRELFASDVALKVRDQKSYLLAGTQLHIFVLTNRCNQRCVYCQASAGLVRSSLSDMTPETGERAADIALQSPASRLSFEFQGGEPSLNFATLRHIVNYTEQHKGDKQIEYSLVTNLVAIADADLAFLAEHHVSVSTSVDGPADLHGQNRPFPSGVSYESVVRNLQRAREAGCVVTGAIQTTTRASLGQAKAIVDAYVSLGFNRIFIRPLTPVGVAKANWDRIGYAPEEFGDFYAQALGYVIELAGRGVPISETHTAILLKRIFNRPSNYMELRSPCGAAIGQVAYNYDGAIYPCDEGRMVAETGDPAFQLGHVAHSRLVDLIESPTTQALCVASCLELLPACSECVYMPYCGTCPVISYSQYGTLFPQRAGDYRCRIYKGMFDNIFSYLRGQNSPAQAALESWI
jgi:uncharacterized protein